MDVCDGFPTVDLDCQIAAASVTNRLEQFGLRVLRSFDLRTAACGPSSGDPCPHHGARPCNCQMVVLLVYGQAGPPLSLVAHGYDHQTGFYLANDPAPSDAPTTELIRRALEDLSRRARSAGDLQNPK